MERWVSAASPLTAPFLCKYCGRLVLSVLVYPFQNVRLLSFISGRRVELLRLATAWRKPRSMIKGHFSMTYLYILESLTAIQPHANHYIQIDQ